MPSIKIRHGDGTWKTVSNAKLKVKWGTAWVTPTSMKVQLGTWKDTGYVGTPAEPINLAVNAWNYDNVTLKWAHGSGGAPVSTFEAQQRSQAGGVISTLIDATSPSSNFHVDESTRYQFYVRAKSSSGAVSDWVGPLKVLIGKPASTSTSTEPDTRPYTKAEAVNGFKDQRVGPVIPTNVQVQGIRYQISANGGFASILSPYNNREIRRSSNGANYELFSWDGSVDVTVNVPNYTSNGGVQGLICLGAGWSVYDDGQARAVGTITVNGVETYNKTVVTTVPAVANSYW